MKKTLFFGLMLTASVILTGCLSGEPMNTSAGMNGLQQRTATSRNIGEDLGASYDEVWDGALATLQLNGFIVKQADKKNGYIYGVWQDAYERQSEITHGGFVLVQLQSSPAWSVGGFFSKTNVWKQIEVSVTLDKLAANQTLVRIAARFDSNGTVLAEGTFANRFFGLLRKEIFLRKANGSIYQTYSSNNK